MKKPLKLKKEKACAERDEVDVAYEALLLREPVVPWIPVGRIATSSMFVYSVTGSFDAKIECYDHVEMDGFSLPIWKRSSDGIS